MQDFEQTTKDRFVNSLSAAEGTIYQTDGRHVRNRAGSKRNFDFHLISENGETIALELTTLTPGRQELNDSAHFDEFVRTINRSVDSAKLAGSFMISAPYGALGSLNKWRVQLEKYGAEVADEITRAVKDLLQTGEERELRTALDDYVIEKVDGKPGGLSFNGVSPNEHWGDYQGFDFILETLERTLEKKNNQLDTAASDRRILVISNRLGVPVITNRLRPPLSELVRKAIRQIRHADSTIMSNIDEVFFEEELSRFERVYVRCQQRSG